MSEPTKRHFLTVLLTDSVVQSALVLSDGQTVELKEFSSIKTYFDRQDLIEQLDKSLQELGPDSQDVVETIFAFDQEWLVDGELSDEKKPVVKQAAESLTLEAVGQCAIPEALAEARLIGDEHDSCLLLVFKEATFELIFLEHGQFIDLLQIGRSANVVDDLAEALARVARHLKDSHKYFPDKVLLSSVALSTKELELLKQQLVAVDWTSNPGFSSTPAIVVLEADYMIKSVSLSAGKVLTKTAFLAKTPTPAASLINDYAVEKSTVAPTTASSFGISFDHTQIANGSRLVSSPVATDSKATNAQDLVAEPTTTKESSFSSPKKARSPWLRFYLSHQKMILLGIGSGLLALLILAAVFVLFLSKVTVLVSPEESLLQKTVKITLDPSISESDFSKATLKASMANKTITGQDVLATTGIGLVGDKAKGRVVIYNKTKEEVELDAATELSKDGIIFLTDEKVKIPAAIEKDGGSGVDYGSIEVSVTAQDIGAEANLNKETKLRVADYFDDEFAATTLDTFAGGSSREVRVVAEADRQQLATSLQQKLMADAKKELEQESKDGVYLVPTGVNKVLSSDFSAEIGAETESLTLSLSLEVEVIKYLSADLKKLGLAILEQELPAGYVLLDQEPSLLSDKAQVASGSSRVNLNADLSAKATAALDLDALEKQVLGKNWLEAVELLEDQAEIKKAEVLYMPPFLSAIMRTLPSDANRVTIQLSK